MTSTLTTTGRHSRKHKSRLPLTLPKRITCKHKDTDSWCGYSWHSGLSHTTTCTKKRCVSSLRYSAKHLCAYSTTSYECCWSCNRPRRQRSNGCCTRSLHSSHTNCRPMTTLPDSSMSSSTTLCKTSSTAATTSNVVSILVCKYFVKSSLVAPMFIYHPVVTNQLVVVDSFVSKNTKS